MNKLCIISVFIIGFLMFSCSEDNNSNTNPPETIKKLTSENITTTHGNFLRSFTYNSENKVSEINITYTGDDQWTPDLINIVFNYDNNLINSAARYDDGQLYTNSVFNYQNNQLIEIINYLPNGNEDSKIEYSYNTAGNVSSYNYYVEEELQQVMNFEFDENGNLTNANDGTDSLEFMFDLNYSAFEYFTYPERLIFAYDFLYENISTNNITTQIITYNAGSSSEVIFYYNTAIEYDNENYPTNKTTIQTYNGTDSTIRTIEYEYE